MANAVAAIAGELIAEVEAEGGLANEMADESVEEEEGEGAEGEAVGGLAAENEPLDELGEQELPADIEAFLSEDEPLDEDEDEEPEPEAASEWEYADAEQERIRAHKAERKAAHLEKQMLRVQRKEWAEEINKHFRFADPKIAEHASSRREALREAKTEHDLALRGAEAIKSHYEQNLEKIIQERVEDELAKVKAAWGVPISGPGQAPAEAAERAEVQSAIANATSLKDRLLLKIQSGNLEI